MALAQAKMTASTPKSPSSRDCMNGAMPLSFDVCCRTLGNAGSVLAARYAGSALRDSLTNKATASRQHNLPSRFAPPKTSPRWLIKRKDSPTARPQPGKGLHPARLPRAFEKKRGGAPLNRVVRDRQLVVPKGGNKKRKPVPDFLDRAAGIRRGRAWTR